MEETRGKTKSKSALSRMGAALRCVCFLLLTWFLFTRVSYLFRLTQTNMRTNVLGFYSEPEDTLDVVVIGASSIYRYFDPYQAYEEFGFTSYSYAVAAMQNESMVGALRDVLEHQKPKVILLDSRRFRAYSDELRLNNLRNLTDAMPYTVNRFQTIQEYCDLFGVSYSERPALWFDLMLYHNNYDVLKNMENWLLIDNRIDADDDVTHYPKGYGGMTRRKALEMFDGLDTTKTRKLGTHVGQAYRDLLSYAAENDIPVVVVCTPYQLTEKNMEEYNKMAEVAAEYGFPYVNMNKPAVYAEAGIDYETDFYNHLHANILGGAKTTRYLSNYVKEHFDLPDHRGQAEDPACWDAQLPEYDENMKEMVLTFERNAPKISETIRAFFADKGYFEEE